jgi:endonuclease III related protein
MGKDQIKKTLIDIYRSLLACYGPQHWWPAEEPFEVIVGAILTQSAAWTNVEKGIANLKQAGVLSPQALRNLPQTELARLIHPCGYYNIKAIKLQAFTEWLGAHYGDSLEKMGPAPTQSLREDLLGVYGIGEETADSILLYVCRKPVFVVDAYTRRVVDRLGLKPEGPRYLDYQKLFLDNLTPDVPLFNEYHALLVALGKNICRKSQPLCKQCCLSGRCSLK